jgi:shikimate kinase
VLVGTRGVGKSTLGVFASTALRRRLIDTDYTFQELTGHSNAAYRRLHGTAHHLKRSYEVLKTVLQTYDKNCVIIFSSGSLDRDSHALLREYAEAHPVIHVVRDTRSIQEYLKIGADKVSNLLEISGTLFRSCSNFEFFNYPERSAASTVAIGDAQLGSGRRSPAPYLALKKAERHFLKFLSLATKTTNFPSLEDAYPLTQVPTERRKYTYAVSVALDAICDPSADVEIFEYGADAFELCFRLNPSSM